MKHQNINKKMWTFIACILLLLVFMASASISYLISKTDEKENEFIPAFVSCEVVESFDGSVKSDVGVKNTGNVDAYIRATVIVTYVDELDPSRVLGRSPILDSDYTLKWGDSAWAKGADGFWYYREPIAPGAVSTDLIDEVKPLNDAPEGYRLSVQILATAIQAQPANVVTDHWDVNEYGGQITPIT